MKANELMIGDWVMTPYGPHKIDILYGDYGKVQADLIELDYSEIQPTPLTTEILEKNGFVKHKDTNTWVWEEKHISNTDIMYQAPRACFTKEFHDERGLHTGGWIDVISENGRISVEGENVHQLQHALRLCGIEKEIVI